ncbi:hypothetical protein [Fodinicola feengrottensis]|uniref:Uncharacterized protein n=1 Tax=Fodinicola feengrottensis TaxID=435914 RepID=A0ABN2J6C0_9ACTN|nr:hypothetical protein [Fodinicola feengrottensis]
MQLTFLGKVTQGTGSPTLFATDRGSYVVQGWKVTGRTGGVEIPHRLLGFLIEGTCLDVQVVDTGRGTFEVYGAPVADTQALSQMDIPTHETCIEVGTGKEVWVNGVPTG